MHRRLFRRSGEAFAPYGALLEKMLFYQELLIYLLVTHKQTIYLVCIRARDTYYYNLIKEGKINLSLKGVQLCVE
jgi:hypothetical protein